MGRKKKLVENIDIYIFNNKKKEKKCLNALIILNSQVDF